MKIINLGYGYRLYRRDSRNWELQQWREPSPDSGGRKSTDKVAKWFNCGKFYQSLRAALLAVYELELRKGDDAVDLEEALARAEEIEKSLKAVSVNLLRLK